MQPDALTYRMSRGPVPRGTGSTENRHAGDRRTGPRSGAQLRPTVSSDFLDDRHSGLRGSNQLLASGCSGAGLSGQPMAERADCRSICNRSSRCVLAGTAPGPGAELGGEIRRWPRRPGAAAPFARVDVGAPFGTRAPERSGADHHQCNHRVGKQPGVRGSRSHQVPGRPADLFSDC